MEEEQDNVNDSGYVARQNLFSNGAKAEFVTKIFSDLFQQDRLMVNQMDLDIEIMPRTNDNFCILAPTNDTNTYRIVIDNCRLYIKSVDIIDGLSLGFAAALNQAPAKYPIKRTEMKSMFIGVGRREFTCCLFNDQVPRRIVLGLVKHSAFTGGTNRSPFNFINAGVQSITLTANGQQFPSAPYYLNFENNNYARAYHHMQENMGHAFSNSSNTISLKKFKDGWCFFVFNLTSTQEDEPGFDLLKTGATSLIIKFDMEVPTGGYELVAYAEYDGLLIVDANRTIASDVVA